MEMKEREKEEVMAARVKAKAEKACAKEGKRFAAAKSSAESKSILREALKYLTSIC